MSRNPAPLAATLLAIGCATTPHVPVDLHLDVDAAPLVDAAYVRLCAADGVAAQYGATMRGTYVLTGLFYDVDPVITVDVLDLDEQLIARAGPTQVLSAYQVTALDDAPCADDPSACAPCTGCVLQNVATVTWDDAMPLCQPGEVPDRDDSAALGVRFRDPAVVE